MMLPSIRRRLSVSLVVVSVVWALAVAAAVGWVVRHEVEEVMDDTMVEAAELLVNTLAWARPVAKAAGPGELPAPNHEEHMVWQLLDGQGRVMLRSHLAPAAPLVVGLTHGFADVQPSWRVHAMPLGGEPGTLLVAQPVSERDEAVLETTQYAAGAALALGLSCAAWLSLRVSRELKPLDKLSKAVAAYDPMAEPSGLGAPERAELVPMHQAIEGMGRRLGLRVRHERAFAAHAAHALRTPLAGLVAQLSVAERHSTPEGRAALSMARSAADRLRRVVSALLGLFRSGHDLRLAQVDLPALVQQLTPGGLAVEVAQAGPASVRADPDLLAAALANLLDNAVRHGAGRVSVQAFASSGTCGLTVTDDGPGIAPDKLQALQAALDHPDENPSGGLGLKMADWVARAHGGRLRLVPVARGCQVELGLGCG